MEDEGVEEGSGPSRREGRSLVRLYARIALVLSLLVGARLVLVSDAGEPPPDEVGGVSEPISVPIPRPLVAAPEDSATSEDGVSVFEDATELAGLDVEHRARRSTTVDVPRGELASLAGDDLSEEAVAAWADRTFSPYLTDVLTLDQYGTGQAWGDFDRDGDPDLYLTNQYAPNTLIENRGDGTFAVSGLTDQVARDGAVSTGAVFVDADGDGWLDLHVVGPESDALFRNEAGTRFVNVTERAGIDDPGEGQTATWADFDRDGDLDVYVVNYGCQPCNDAPPVPKELRDQDRLFRNEGDMRFSDQTALITHVAATRGLGFSGQWFDADDDGDPDLYVVNDVRDDQPDGEVSAGKAEGPGSTPGNVLLRNDGPGCDGWCFTDVSDSAGAGVRANAMGLAVGDADGDGDPDLFFTNSGFAAGPTQLLLNDGTGSFSPSAPGNGSDLGEWSWGTNFLDADNDGSLDLYVAVGLSDAMLQVPTAALPTDAASRAATYRLQARSGELPTSGPVAPPPWRTAESDHPRTNNDRLLLRRGDRYVEQVLGRTDELAGSTFGSAVADYDGDGWPDVVIGDLDDRYRLLRNRSKVGVGNHRLVLRLEGDGTRINRQAVGTRVKVTTPDGRTRTRFVAVGGSLGSGDDTAIIVGLGNQVEASIEIRWTDGTSTNLEASADVSLTIDPAGPTGPPRPLRTPA